MFWSSKAKHNASAYAAMSDWIIYNQRHTSLSYKFLEFLAYTCINFNYY